MSDLVDNSQADIDKSNEKKQNDILARREARRKRILENAKSRLDKLSGGGADGGISPTNNHRNHSPEKYSDPEIEHPEYMNDFNPSHITTTNFGGWESSPLQNTATVLPPTKFEKILSSRVHVVAASAITYALIALGLHAIVWHSLFVVFLSLECLELIFFRRERPLSPLLNMVLMLSGINVGKAGLYLKLFGLLNKMVCDLGLFVFCFVLSHGFYCGFVEGTLLESFYSF